MRYYAQRITNGKWLHKELPLTDVERTKTLSGPGGLVATIKPSLLDQFANDGLRVIEEWGTYVYAVDDNDEPVHGGIVIDCAYEDEALRMTCAGFTTYPHGYLYDEAKNWGPIQGNGTVANPQTPRPDPVVIAQELWDYIQSQPESDFGVQFRGDLTSKVRVGSYEEPYRLRWWESPDIGQAIDDLAALTPFGYTEEYERNGNGIGRYLRIGVPRIGKRQEGLRFATGENIASPIVAATTGADYSNDLLGIGNGEGRDMVRSRSTVRDGRVRRTRIITDKTIKSQAKMDSLVLTTREQMRATLDVTSVEVWDHPNARLSTIGVGDDIRVQTYIPAYGDVDMWVRVLSITQGDNPDAALLTTQRSSAFVYSSTLEVG